MDWKIIDAIGPFFKGYKKTTINWSKIPFRNLEKNGQVNTNKFEKIRPAFEQFCVQAKSLGYDTIALDDIAHLVLFEFYPKKLRQKINAYQNEFDQLFIIAKKLDLKIVINSDIMFFNKWIEKHTKGKLKNAIALLAQACDTLLEKSPIDGIVLRIGESDGIDVREDFKSRLILKKPSHVRYCINELMPVFKKHQKHLIFRTWTVGVYPIGDLIWNPATYHQSFNSIDSEYFIVSMKFGDTDFFDHLELNPLLTNSRHKKIIELQARREREGFGVFPWYVGWQYEKYYQQLKDNPLLVGISVWCQTGGWSKWRNYTFLKQSSLWNELNTRACIRIFENGESANEILKTLLSPEQITFLVEFQSIFDKILYIEGFAEKSFYLRRFRIPPLLWLYWDNVTISPFLIAFLDYTGMKPIDVSLGDLKEVRKRGKVAKIENIDYIYDTLRVLLYSRRALYKKSAKPKYLAKIAQYQKKYPASVDFSITFSTSSHRMLKFFFQVCVRQTQQYRFIDRILLSGPVSFLFRVFIHFYMRHLPSFVNKQAMKIDSIFY